MKTRLSLLGLIGVSILVLVGLWWRFHPEPMKPLSPSQLEAASNYPANAVSSKTPVAGLTPLKEWRPGMPAPRLFKSTNYPPQTAEEKALWDWYRDIRKKDPSFEWKMPIEFYGKVVDQDGKPLAGARIEYMWNSTNGTPHRETHSLQDGSFEIKGIFGKILTVNVDHPDYYYGNESHGAFEYADFSDHQFHTPDPNQPVIFKLRKEGNTEPLYRWDVNRDSTVDGQVVWYDLRSQKTGASGDFGISIRRSNQKSRSQFDTTITIEAAPGGGLQTTEEEFMFEAPAEGYQPMLRLDQKTEPPFSRVSLDVQYYLRTPQGKYAAVKAHFGQYGTPSADVRLMIFYNPSGSRNLEYDYQKRIDDNR
jgi:hypothetical protein